MNLTRLLLKSVIIFGIGILVLDGIVIYQDRVIQKQRILIKELYKGHPCGGVNETKV